jgi:hypothetical protein
MTETRVEHLPGDWKRKPENKNELECVVEREPVHRADGALKDGQEGKYHPILVN